jgi:hypothetical protein
MCSMWRVGALFTIGQERDRSFMHWREPETPPLYDRGLILLDDVVLGLQGLSKTLSVAPQSAR